MLASVLHLGCVLAASSSDSAVGRDLDVMGSVPLLRNSYVPLFAVDAAYRKGEGKDAVEARLILQTRRPMVNLDNFRQISAISCTNTQLIINFRKDTDAEDAHRAWSAAKNMTVFVGHQHECNNGEIAVFELKNISIQRANVAIDVVLIDKKHVISKYKVQVGLQASKVIRDNHYQHSLIEESHHPSELDKFYLLDLNYNSTEMAVINPEISVYNDDLVKISCTNCYTTGAAKLNSVFETSEDEDGLQVVDAYSFMLYGNLQGNIDLSLEITANITKRHSILAQVFTESMYSVGVPGLFQFQPELRFKAGVGINSATPISANVGMDLKYDFNYKIFSDYGVLAKPQFLMTGTPILTPHKPNLNALIDIDAYAIPDFYLGFKILMIQVNVEVSSESRLSVQLSTGKEELCPQDKFNILLMKEYQLKLDFGPAHMVLFKEDLHPFACIFCNVCPLNVTSHRIDILTDEDEEFEIIVGTYHSTASTTATQAPAEPTTSTDASGQQPVIVPPQPPVATVLPAAVNENDEVPYVRPPFNPWDWTTWLRFE